MPSLQEREAAFHDEAYASAVRAPTRRFYAANKQIGRRYRERLADVSSRQRVLEYGCGEGSNAFLLAKNGAEVVGIDISTVGVEHARERARRKGVEASTDFRVMDAMNLDLPEDSFDLVCGRGILHHLDLNLAMRETVRVLKPTGEALFAEPLGHNPAINLYRRITPRMRTPDEHPLVMRDFDLIRGYFEEVDLEFFTLSTLAGVPLRNRRLYPRLQSALERFDQRLFRTVPYLKRHAWYVLLHLKRPVFAPAG